jgi:hypothetical protein
VTGPFPFDADGESYQAGDCDAERGVEVDADGRLP